jgi:L-lactate dehydrogenase (cytochrome)
MSNPRWAIDVGLLGRPHDLGNISRYRGHRTGLEDYIGWLGANFDPSITWADLDWLRGAWSGRIIIKGILDPEDARAAQSFGADAVVVSNHGGRQLDGVPATARVLSAIVDALGGAMPVLADSGIRSGLDVVRMLALGADAVLLGRAYIYALAAAGEEGVVALIEAMRREISVAMTLTGARLISDINASLLADTLPRKGHS